MKLSWMLAGFLTVLVGCNGDNGRNGGGGGGGDTGVTNDVRQPGCSGLDPADRAPLGGWLAMTFDDGPHPTVTPQVLTVLRKYDVPATFFMIGQNISDPDNAVLVQEIIDDPLFDVANHTWDHPNLRDRRLSQVRQQLVSTTDAFEAFGVTPTFFRFPFGSSDCDRNRLVREELGLIVTGWHIDTADWCYATGDVGACEYADYWRVPDPFTRDMYTWTLDQIETFDGGVMLYHDNHQYTADQIEDVIVAAQANGYTFTRLDDAEAFPELNAGTFYDFPWMGESCTLTDDTCWQVEYLSYCAEADADGEHGVCVLPCRSDRDCIDRDGVADTACVRTPLGDTNCLALSQPENLECDDVPGTVRARLQRERGGSALVCMPAVWEE